MNQEEKALIERMIPGILGSFVGLYFFRTKTIIALGMMFVGGVAASYYGAPFIVKLSGNDLDTGLAGFLTGMFGMTVAASVFSAWASINFNLLASEWVSKFLRLPAPPIPPTLPATEKDASK